MKNIDFLPEVYRQQEQRRKYQAWRVLLAVIFAAAVGSTALFQQALKRGAQADLAAWQGPYEAVAAENAELAQLQIKLQAARTKAGLFAFLRHPWPKSRLLAALAAPLPDSMTLTEVRIELETAVAGPLAHGPQAAPAAKADPAELAKLSPVEKDLQKLRDESERARTLVFLTGETSDTADLHVYLAKLASAELFVDAQVTSIESIAAENKTGSRFTAQLVVRPAYGQPGGPKLTTAASPTTGQPPRDALAANPK